MAKTLMDVKFVLIILSLIVLILPPLASIWAREDPTTMTVTADLEIDVAAEVVLVLLIDVEDTIVQEAAADLGLVKYEAVCARKEKQRINFFFSLVKTRNPNLSLAKLKSSHFSFF